MARRVVGDAFRKLSAARRTRRGQELAHIAHLRRELRGALAPFRVVGQQMRILLHHRAAAGGIRADEIRVRLLECRDVRAGEGASAIEIAGVRVQGAATPLPRCTHHLVAVHHEGALRGAIRLREESFHHASEQQSHTSAPAVTGRSIRTRS